MNAVFAFGDFQGVAGFFLPQFVAEAFDVFLLVFPVGAVAVGKQFLAVAQRTDFLGADAQDASGFVLIE